MNQTVDTDDSGTQALRHSATPRRILAADDDPTSLRLLSYLLASWGYDVVTATNGKEALELIELGGINLAILDWKMPLLEGVQVARWIRHNPPPDGYVYIILVTGKDSVEDVVAGLEAGADDYVRKPANSEELRSRIRAGERVVDLERTLAARAAELREALDNVKLLKGLIPVCMYCKKIRRDQDYWQQMEAFIGEQTDASFTHSICPDCREKIVKPMLEDLQREKNEN